MYAIRSYYERVEPVVHAVDLRFEFGIVPAHVGFAQLRQAQGCFAQESIGKSGLRYGGLRDRDAPSSGGASFKRRITWYKGC